MGVITQGDILQVEGVPNPVLVVSKNYFNTSEQIIACPILSGIKGNFLHTSIETKDMQGTVVCEQLRLLDLRRRGYKKVSEIHAADIMNIVDIIQGIFDYYPY